MKRWLVITPEYGEVVPILDYGQGPLEYQADVIEVEAESRRDAILIGVQLMRANPREYHWFRHADGNPFVGVKAELMPEKCSQCDGLGLTDNDVTGEVECLACEGSGCATGWGNR